MGLTFPYQFKLRRIDRPAGHSSEVGFVCREQGNLGTRQWSRVIQGEIPARLSEGAGEINDGSGVTYTAWERLHSGGQGANEADDLSRYRYAQGVYTGDDTELYLQPAWTTLTKNTGVLPAGQVVKQILPWAIQRSIVTSNSVGTITTEVHDNGLLTAGTYYYAITSVSATGNESAPSTQFSVAPGNAKNSVRINWSAVPASAKYNVYRGTINNGTKNLVGSVTGDATRTSPTGFVYRFVDTGEAPPGSVLSGSASAAVTTNVRRLLVFADDGTMTYLYEVPYVNDKLGTAIAPLTVKNVSNADATSLSGKLDANACTIYQNRVYIPTYTDDGTQLNRVLYYDSSAIVPLQIRDITNGVSARRYVADATRRLWAFIGNAAFHCADPQATNPEWQGPLAVGDPALPITSALVYGGTGASDSATYIAKPDGLFRMLETAEGAGKSFERVTSLGMTDAATGAFLVEHRGELYIGAREQLFRYNLATVDSSEPNKNRGLPSSLRGQYLAAVSSGRHCYVLSVPASNITPGATPQYGYQHVVETEQGEAWHQYVLFQTGVFSETMPSAGDRWAGRCLVLLGAEMTQDERAVLLMSGGDGGNDLVSVPVRLGTERLREAKGYTARATGTLVLPPYYGGAKAIAKNWHWIQVAQHLLTAPNAATLTVDAREMRPSNPAPTLWTTIGTRTSSATGLFYTTPGTYRQYVSFPAVGATPGQVWCSEGIQIRLTLSRGTDGITPVFENAVVTSSETKNTLRRWVYIVDFNQQAGLKNRARIYNTHTEMVTAIDALEDFAANMYPWIHTDMLGRESVVRVDVQYVQPENVLEQWNQEDAPQIEWIKMAASVTITELYNTRSYPGSTENGS